MVKNRIIHNYTLPSVYRILVVDDKLGKEQNIAYRNCFDACIKAKAKTEDFDIEIDYSKAVDDGFDKWLKNSYDLVLIDYDFIKTAEDIDNTKFTLSTIFPTRAGAGLFGFIKQLINQNEYYKYKEHQKIYIWTSHRWDKEVNGKKEGVSIDVSPEDRAYFKKKDEWDIDKLCGEIKIDLTNWTLEYVLERLVSLSLSENKNNRLAGYVAFKKNDNWATTIYSPLVDKKLEFKEIVKENGKGYLYLLPDEPKQGEFTYYCSIDKLQITRKLNRRLNGNDLRKALYGGKNEEDKTQLPEGAIRNSSSLDKDSLDIKNEEKEYSDFLNNCGFKKNNKDAPNNCDKAPFAGVPLKSDIWLAATPLTTVTRVGENKNVIGLLIRKLEAFFNIGIGAAVLKTTYLEAGKIEWPKDHIQRYHRTRVFEPSKPYVNKKDLAGESAEWYQEEITEKLEGISIRAQMDYQLWNTGKTALESFPPCMVNQLLKEIEKGRKEWKNRIIVSLGLKTHEKDGWKSLFEKVFNGINNGFFPLVEINVRHFMRPLLEEYLGGDEYLAPMDKNKMHNYSGLFFEFGERLKQLHEVGKEYNKKIILKFPFRSDIIPFLRIAEDIAKIDNIDDPKNYGISGITLINTVKSPYPYELKKEQKPSDDETIKIPQMSGEYLAWTRNYLLKKIDQIGFKLPVSVSGGVGIAEDDIDYIRQICERVKSIQIGTYFLKRIDSNQINKLKNKLSKRFLNVEENTSMGVRIIHLLKDKCATRKSGRCGSCYNSYYCDVFLNRGAKYEVPLMDLTACTGCGLCENNCPTGALKMKNANEFVILCCGFSESRFAILRENEIEKIENGKIPFIHMETKGDIHELRKGVNEFKLNNINIEHCKEIHLLLNNASNCAQKKALYEAYWRAMYQFCRCQQTHEHKDEVIPLEHSVYLGVKTYLEGKNNKRNGGFEVLNLLNDADQIEKSLKKYNSYKATTAYVCIKKNKKIEGDVEKTKEFKINTSFIENADQIKSYSPHGIGRAGGIDILGHGSILFGDLSGKEGDVMAFAGLPLKAIETIEKLRKK